MPIALLVTLAAACFASVQDSPQRQFDFWVGEWSVQNRHIQPDGTWKDGDTTRARITPVIGGMALLEEWAGPFHGGYMNGFSLRAFDPVRQDWNLLLFWTSDGNGSFGTLRGKFRHGRGEFLAGRGAAMTRYSFSDALPNTVRWDSATTKDAGLHWATDWIMEFSRTRNADEVTQERLFDVAWTEGQLSPHPEARHMDWMLGKWNGVQVDGAGEKREARLRCKLLNKDCLVLDVLETRAPGDDDWHQRLAVRAFSSSKQAWQAWLVSSDDTVLRPALGTPEAKVAVFESQRAGEFWRETLTLVGPDDATIEEEMREEGSSEFVRVRLTTLRRE